MDSILTQFVEAEPVIDAAEEKAEVIVPSADDKDTKLRAKRQWIYHNDPDVINMVRRDFDTSSRTVERL